MTAMDTNLNNTPSALFTTKSIDQTVEELHTNPITGLSTTEADFRVQRYGRNELEREQEESLIMKFLDQLKQPLIMLLLASAAISAVLGQYDDAFSIALAILIVVSGEFLSSNNDSNSKSPLCKSIDQNSHWKH